MIKEKTKSFKTPHSYIIIGCIIVFVTILTYVVPAGEFDRVLDEATDRVVVLPESFHYVDQQPVGLFKMMQSVYEGMVDASDIIFFIFFAYGFVHILVATGALDGGMGWLIGKVRGKENLFIPILILTFGVLGSTFGMYEEVYGIIPVAMAMGVALGYDPMVGAVCIFVGVATGFAAATTNPFTIGVAQKIAQLPPFSGIGFRIVIWVAFMSLVIWYTMRYAKKVKADPTKSVVYGVDFPFIKKSSPEEMMKKPFTLAHKLSLLCFAITIVMLVVGTLKLGWYLAEISTLFVIMMFIIGFLNKYSPSKVATTFVEAVKMVAFGALVVGVSRAVVLILNEGSIIDTIVYSLANAIAGLHNIFAALGMLVFQNLTNFFIPSGSGQAATSMPIMVPLADLIGMNRQVAVLAFQFGDGFSNLFWPTVVAVECGIAGIPLNKWYKWMGPLFLWMLGLQVILMIVSVLIGYGPF